MFHEKDNDYNLRSKNLLMLPQSKTTTYGNDSLSFRGSILWNSLPNDNKTATSVCPFKSYIKDGMGRIVVVKYVNRVFQVLRWLFDELYFILFL